MRKLFARFLPVVLILFLAAPATAAEPGPSSGSDGPLIRVGLWTGQGSLLVAGAAPVRVTDSAKKTVAQFAPGEKVTIGQRDGLQEGEAAREGVGKPLVVIVKLPTSPNANVVLSTLVNKGASSSKTGI